MSALTVMRQPVAPSRADADLARESSRALARAMSAKSAKPVRVRFEGADGKREEVVAIPASAFQLLNNILTEMAKGNAVTIIPIHAELTTQQAADILNVSRPFLVEQLENGAIPFHKVGSHRRVLFANVMDYKEKIDRDRLESLQRLSEIDQELGLS